MENYRKPQSEGESDILFSKTVKAGQRIYYIDVKQNRKGEMYLCVTESKKSVSGPTDMPHVSYEKHKIFLFQEDFSKFGLALSEAFNYVASQQGEAQERPEDDGAIKLDLEF